MPQRIGHGVDVMQESDPEALLRMMAHENVLVEICLTSNDVILNVTGDHHPLPMYLKFGVPVALGHRRSRRLPRRHHAGI